MNTDPKENLRPQIFSRSGKHSPRSQVRLRGKMQNIIVVKPQNPMFRQAVFFLRDDYFLTSDISRTELLNQAKAAAEGYVNENVPPVRGKAILILCLLSALVIAAAFVILIFFV